MPYIVGLLRSDRLSLSARAAGLRLTVDQRMVLHPFWLPHCKGIKVDDSFVSSGRSVVTSLRLDPGSLSILVDSHEHAQRYTGVPR